MIRLFLIISRKLEITAGGVSVSILFLLIDGFLGYMLSNFYLSLFTFLLVIAGIFYTFDSIDLNKFGDVKIRKLGRFWIYCYCAIAVIVAAFGSGSSFSAQFCLSSSIFCAERRAALDLALHCFGYMAVFDYIDTKRLPSDTS